MDLKNKSVSKNNINNNNNYAYNQLMGVEFIGVRGQQAINKLLLEKKGHVKSAFYRIDIGEIDLFWGDESAGLCHIK